MGRAAAGVKAWRHRLRAPLFRIDVLAVKSLEVAEHVRIQLLRHRQSRSEALRHPVFWILMLGVRLACSMHACNSNRGLWLRLCSLSLSFCWKEC